MFSNINYFTVITHSKFKFNVLAVYLKKWSKLVALKKLSNVYLITNLKYQANNITFFTTFYFK